MKKAYRLTSAQELAQVFLHHIENIANQKNQYILKIKKSISNQREPSDKSELVHF